jgi:hypothetical protein
VTDDIDRLRAAGRAFRVAGAHAPAPAATPARSAGPALVPATPPRRPSRLVLVPALATLVVVAGVAVGLGYGLRHAGPGGSGGLAAGGDDPTADPVVTPAAVPADPSADPSPALSPAGPIWLPPHATTTRDGLAAGVLVVPPGVTIDVRDEDGAALADPLTHYTYWAALGDGDLVTVPHVVVYGDFQGPFCALAGPEIDPVVGEYADAGRIALEYQDLSFLDNLYGNDSSFRAAQAVACADDVGLFREVHAAILAGQPAEEGAGFGDEFLRSDVILGALAGVADVDTGALLERYQACYDSGQAADFVTQVGQTSLAAAVAAVEVDGVPVHLPSDPAAIGPAVREAIEAALARHSAAGTEPSSAVASPGAELVAVPDVVGKSREEAEAILREAGFDVTVDVVYDLVGIVAEQNPAQDTPVPAGTTVTIRVI